MVAAARSLEAERRAAQRERQRRGEFYLRVWIPKRDAERLFDLAEHLDGDEAAALRWAIRQAPPPPASKVVACNTVRPTLLSESSGGRVRRGDAPESGDAR